MDRVEAPRVDPMADRPPPEAELDELPARHDSVLTGGERGDMRIDPFEAALGASVGSEGERNVHASIVAVTAMRRTPDLHRFAREMAASLRRSRPPLSVARRSAPISGSTSSDRAGSGETVPADPGIATELPHVRAPFDATANALPAPTPRAERRGQPQRRPDARPSAPISGSTSTDRAREQKNGGDGPLRLRRNAPACVPPSMRSADASRGELRRSGAPEGLTHAAPLG